MSSKSNHPAPHDCDWKTRFNIFYKKGQILPYFISCLNPTRKWRTNEWTSSLNPRYYLQVNFLRDLSLNRIF